jgi:hypothetical protein
MASANSARPSIEELEIPLDHPDLLIPQYEDELFPFRNHSQALCIAEHGLKDKAFRLLECGYVFTFKCPEHKTRRRIPKDCRLRFCPDCSPDLIKRTLKRHQHHMDFLHKAARTAHYFVVLCEVRYETIIPIEKVEAMRVWKDVAEKDFTSKWEAYFRGLHVSHHYPLLTLAACNGLENVNGKEQLVFHAFIAVPSADYKYQFKKLWPDAKSVKVERIFGLDMLQHQFQRALTPLESATKGQRLAYHELIFDKSRMFVVVVNGQLFPKEIPIGNKSDGDEASEWPSNPFCCDICGKTCTVTLENPTKHTQESASPPSN